MKKIILSNAGCTTSDVDMGAAGTITFLTRYNYTAQCWTLDLIDSSGALIVGGIMLVPDVNLIAPYPSIGDLLGELYLFETTPGTYMNPDSLGVTNYILWTPVDEIGGNIA